MHLGRSLQSLATTVQAQAESRRDLIADPRALSITLDEIASETARHRLSLKGSTETHALSEIAHDQLAEYLDVPRDYYRRLRAELADVKPFPQLTRVQPAADLVVIRFAAGEQTRRLRAAGFSIDDLKRAGFRYHFSGEWRAVRNETTLATAESIAEAKV